MNSSQVPAKFKTVWGSSASPSFIQAVPDTYSGTPGSASMSLGWGPETFQDPSIGGTAPLGEYENGIWNQATANLQWLQAGGIFKYDAAMSTAIGGYPRDAILKAAAYSAFWVSTAENNVVNPDTGTLTSPATGWAVLQPGTYPWSQITGTPNVVVHADFTTGQLIGPNGSQDTPDGYRNQWMEIPVFGAVNTLVNVTYPEAFTTTSYKPRASVFDSTLNAGSSSNFLAATVISNSNSGCQVVLGQNGGGARNVTLCVDVRGRTL